MVVINSLIGIQGKHEPRRSTTLPEHIPVSAQFSPYPPPPHPLTVFFFIVAIIVIIIIIIVIVIIWWCWWCQEGFCEKCWTIKRTEWWHGVSYATGCDWILINISCIMWWKACNNNNNNYSCLIDCKLESCFKKTQTFLTAEIFSIFSVSTGYNRLTLPAP